MRKNIDHDPNEGLNLNLPNYDLTWEERKNGSKRTFGSALPLIIIVTALYFARVGWPF